MYVFLLCFDTGQKVIWASGIARSREADGETVASLEGKTISDFCPTPESLLHNQNHFEKVLREGGQTAFYHTDERGEHWAARFVRIPEGTRVISLSTKLPARPHESLTERDIHVLNLLADDCKIAEIREQLNLTSQQWGSIVRELRRKLKVKTTHGLVSMAIKTGLISE